MVSREALDVLHQFGQLDWPTLFLGWKRRWVTRSDVIDVAVQWLEEHLDENDARVALLAGGDDLEDDELEALLASYVVSASGSLPDGDGSIELDRWRFAHLRALADSALDAETKLERLEELYSEFGYPEDMAACSRYYVPPSQQHWEVGDQGSSPLAAMSLVLEGLSRKLGVGHGSE